MVIAVQSHENPCDKDALGRHVPPLKQIDGFAAQIFDPLNGILQKIPVKFGGQTQRIVLEVPS